PPVDAPSAAPAPELAVKRVAALHLEPQPAPDRPPAVFFPEEDAFLLPLSDRLLFSFPRDAWLARGEPIAGDFDRGDLEAGTTLLRGRSALLASAATGGRAFFDAYAP